MTRQCIAMKSMLMSTVLIFALACVGGMHSTPDRVAVCVWRGGDDGLTVRLADKLEETINSTRTLVIGGCGVEDQPTIALPSVRWEKRGTSIHVTARVAVTGPRLTAPLNIESHCSEDRLGDCANDIVNGALAAWNMEISPSH